MDIKVIVATHKHYWMPSDSIYLPVHVGAANKDSIGYQRDDEGENISLKNPNYCELTGLYWAWKNLDSDYIGLAHYRRHFSNGKHLGSKKERVITGKELEAILLKEKTGDNSVKTSFTSAAGPPAKEAYSKQASERRRL